MDKHQSRQITGLVRQIHGLDSQAAPSLLPVFLRIRPFSVTQGGHREHRGVRLHRRDIDNLIVLIEPHAANADGVPAHVPDVALIEADRLSLPGGHQHLVVAGAQPDADQLVSLPQHDRDQAVLPQIPEFLQRGLLDHGVPGSHHQIVFLLCLAGHGQHRADLFPAGDLQQVDNRGSPGLPARFGNLVALQAVHPAEIGEEHDLLVGADHEELGRIVRVLHVHAADAPAAAVLRPVYAAGHPLDIAVMGQRDHHILFLNQILDVDLALDHRQLAAALVRELVPDRGNLRLDHIHQQMLIRQDRGQAGDGFLQLLIFLHQALPLQTGQAGQAHIQNRLGLLIRKGEAADQRFLGRRRILAGPDDGHDFIDMIQRLQEAFQNMSPGIGLVQLEAGPPGHDILLVLQIIIDHLPQVQHPGLAVHQGQHIGAEVLLQAGMLIQIVQHHLGIDVLLQLDDDPHAVPVALVADVADPLQLLVPHQVGDLFHQLGLVHHIGDFRHHNPAAVAGHFLDIGPAAHGDFSVAGIIGLPDSRAAQNQPSGGEIRPLDMLHQILNGAVRIVDHADDAVDHLRQIVRRNIGRHSDGDAVGAVDQQVREAGGKHRRLLQGFIEVRIEIHRILFDAFQHVHGQLLHPGFRIPHGGRAVSVHAAVVALAFHQRIADVEGLRQTNHGVIHGAVSVGMIFTQHVAHQAGALAEGLVRRHAQLVHVVQNPAVYRLQTVPHVRQGPVNDDRHCVGDKALLHLLFQIYRDQFILNHNLPLTRPDPSPDRCFPE